MTVYGTTAVVTASGCGRWYGKASRSFKRTQSCDNLAGAVVRLLLERSWTDWLARRLLVSGMVKPGAFGLWCCIKSGEWLLARTRVRGVRSSALVVNPTRSQHTGHLR